MTSTVSTVIYLTSSSRMHHWRSCLHVLPVRSLSAILCVVKLRYVVTIDREQDGRFIASVPEVPGCHVYGRTRRQAVARARRALQFYVDSLRKRGLRPPRQPLVAVEVVIAA